MLLAKNWHSVWLSWYAFLPPFLQYQPHLTTISIMKIPLQVVSRDGNIRSVAKPDMPRV